MATELLIMDCTSAALARAAPTAACCATQSTSSSPPPAEHSPAAGLDAAATVFGLGPVGAEAEAGGPAGGGAIAAAAVLLLLGRSEEVSRAAVEAADEAAADGTGVEGAGPDIPLVAAWALLGDAKASTGDAPTGAAA